MEDEKKKIREGIAGIICMSLGLFAGVISVHIFNHSAQQVFPVMLAGATSVYFAGVGVYEILERILWGRKKRFKPENS